MTASNDREAEPGSTGEVSTRVVAHDIEVEKVARRHRDDSVAVMLQLRSTRSDRCEVRIRDPLPEPILDNVVEFHPDYDPSHWTITDQAVVFEAKLEPAAEHAMVYGALIDQPDQLELFAADPTVEVTELDDIFEYWSADGEAPAPERNGPVEPATPAGIPEGDGEDRQTTAGADRGAVGSGRSVVEELLDEVTSRDLSTIEKRELRQAIDVDGVADRERRLESLNEEVLALRASVDALSDTVEELQAEAERGADWRAKVHEAIVFDPDGS